MIIRLAFLLCLTACATDYPSPYSPNVQRAAGTGTLGAWAPPMVKGGGEGVVGYYSALRPFPKDEKPVLQRPKGLLSDDGVTKREAELNALRNSAQKQ